MNIFDLQATIGLNTSGFMSGVQEAQGAFSGLASTVSGAGEGITAGTIAWGTAIGNFATKAAGTIMDFGREITDTGMAFDSSMSNVAAISGATGETLDALRDKAKEMGATTKFTATEAADAFSYMAMAGWDAEQMMSGISGIMNLAAASGEDLATTSDIVTDALTAFGLKAEDSGHFADVLAAASSAANTNVSMMGETFKYVAPLAGTMGYSVEDMATAIGTMANSGIKGSQAGTALRSAITRLVKPTKEVYTALNQIGLEGGAITNADGSMMEFSETVDVLRDAFSDLSEADQAMYAGMIFGQEAMSGMLAIINSSEADYNALAETIGAASEAMNGAGTAAQMAATQLDSLPGQVTLMQSAFDGLKTSIYEGLKGPLQDAAEIATDVFSGLTDAINEGGIAGAFESLGGVIADAFGPKLETALAGAKNMLSGLLDGIGASGGLSGISEALSGFAGSIRPFIEEKFERAAGVFDSIKSALGGLGDTFKNVELPDLSGFATGVKNLFGAYELVNETKMGVAVSVIKGFLDAFKSANVAGLISEIAGGAAELFKAFGIAAYDAMEGVVSAVGSFVDAFDDKTVADIISPIASGAKDLFGAFGSVAADIISDVGENVGEFLDLFAESSVPDIIAEIAKHAGDLLGHLQSAGAKVIEGVGEAVGSFLDAFNKDAAISLMEDVAGFIADLFAPFTDTLGGAIQAAADAFADLAPKIGEFAGEITNGLVDTVQKIVDEFDKWGPLVAGVATGFGTMMIVTSLAAGIKALKAAMESGALAAKVLEIAQAALNVVLNANPIGIVVSVLAALAAAFITAYQTNDEFREKVDETFQKVKEAFEAIGQWLSEFFTSTIPDAFNKVMEWFKGLPEKFKSIGSDIVNGIKNGFTDAWESFKESVSNLANGIVDSVKGLFGIHSPSTVFADIGENLVLGLREGWGDAFGGFESQVDRDVRRITDTARIGFEDSAIGKSSEAGISSMFAANSIDRGGEPVKINLVLDGDVAATALYDPLRRTAFQKGQGTGGELIPA